MNKLIKSEKLKLILSTFFYLVSAGVQIYFAFVLGDIIDSASNADLRKLKFYIAFGFALMIFYLIVTRIGISFRMKFVRNTVIKIKDQLMHGIFNLGIKDFRKENTAYYINCLSSDVDRIDSDYLSAIPIIVFYIGQFVFSIAAMIKINFVLLLAFFAFFLVPIVIPQMLTKKLKKYQVESSSANEKYMFIIKEAIEGYETIIQNMSTKKFEDRVNELNRNQQYANCNTRITKSFINELSSMAGSISQLGCIGFGGYLVARKVISVGELIAAIQIINYCFQPINILGEKFATIKSIKPILNKLDEISQTPKAESEKELVLNNEEGCELRYNQVSFSFGDNVIVDNFNYCFEPKKVYAIIGKSGTGKSTITKLLLKYYDEYDGEIAINNINIKDIYSERLYDMVSVVSQEPYLFNDTLINNITMYNDYSSDEINKVIEFVNLKELIDRYGNDNIGDLGNRISGGEKQRISLARALLKSSKIIIFDEPTSSLDPVNSKKITELIFKLDNVTRIVITHDWDAEYLNRFDGIINLDDCKVSYGSA